MHHVEKVRGTLGKSTRADAEGDAPWFRTSSWYRAIPACAATFANYMNYRPASLSKHFALVISAELIRETRRWPS